MPKGKHKKPLSEERIRKLTETSRNQDRSHHVWKTMGTLRSIPFDDICDYGIGCRSGLIPLGNGGFKKSCNTFE